MASQKVKGQHWGFLEIRRRIVKVGFESDIPGLTFQHHYQEIEHPFYKKIYSKAFELNPKLADSMDTCIVK